ncbi:hypothetical protein STPL106120_04140 [Streptococcus pluranimalium]|uniref:hypothetical protein n=1 Tax=Streptococcus pluranimalium TaxID=82348 RepID=UPI0039EA2970
MKNIFNNKYIHSLLVGLGAGIVAGIFGTNGLIYYLVGYILARGANKLLVN